MGWSLLRRHLETAAFREELVVSLAAGPAAPSRGENREYAEALDRVAGEAGQEALGEIQEYLAAPGAAEPPPIVAATLLRAAAALAALEAAAVPGGPALVPPQGTHGVPVCRAAVLPVARLGLAVRDGDAAQAVADAALLFRMEEGLGSGHWLGRLAMTRFLERATASLETLASDPRLRPAEARRLRESLPAGEAVAARFAAAVGEGYGARLDAILLSELDSDGALLRQRARDLASVRGDGGAAAWPWGGGDGPPPATWGPLRETLAAQLRELRGFVARYRRLAGERGEGRSREIRRLGREIAAAAKGNECLTMVFHPDADDHGPLPWLEEEIALEARLEALRVALDRRFPGRGGER